MRVTTDPIRPGEWLCEAGWAKGSIDVEPTDPSKMESGRLWEGLIIGPKVDDVPRDRSKWGYVIRLKVSRAKDSDENFSIFGSNDACLMADKLDRMKLIYIFMILIIGTESLKSEKFFVWLHLQTATGTTLIAF